jgi:hypothetical protein
MKLTQFDNWTFSCHQMMMMMMEKITIIHRRPRGWVRLFLIHYHFFACSHNQAAQLGLVLASLLQQESRETSQPQSTFYNHFSSRLFQRTSHRIGTSACPYLFCAVAKDQEIEQQSDTKKNRYQALAKGS